MLHHHIKQEDIKEKCPYCGHDLEQESWKSVFTEHMHYKTNPCSCGKEISVSVGFSGSGHDSWSQLEKKVRKHG